MRLKFGSKIYYGWFIVASLAITETVSYGIMYYAFSVFLTPMEAELGWSRGQLTAGLSLALLVSGLMAYPVGWWVDKYGARLLMTLGSIGASLLIVLWSQTTTLWIFYAIWLGIGICSAMVFYEPAFAVIATWFNRKRSQALTIVTLVAGFASTIFQPIANYLLNNFGWRASVLILGIVLAVITIPLNALILRRSPLDLGLLPDGQDKIKIDSATTAPSLPLSAALKSRFFWMLTLSFVIAGFATSALRFHFIPYLEGIGVAATWAAFASGSIGTMQVVGRLIFVPLDEHMSGRIMLACLFLMQALAIAAIFVSSALWSIFVFVALFGASIGMRTLVRPSILAETYGSANYGRISSMMALPLTLSATAAPVIAGLMYDYFENYDLLIVISLCLSILAGVLVFFVRTQHD